MTLDSSLLGRGAADRRIERRPRWAPGRHRLLWSRRPSTPERACRHRPLARAVRRGLGAVRVRRRRHRAGGLRVGFLFMARTSSRWAGSTRTSRSASAGSSSLAAGFPRLGVVQPGCRSGLWGLLRRDGAGHVRDGVRHRHRMVGSRAHWRRARVRPRRRGCRRRREGARVLLVLETALLDGSRESRSSVSEQSAAVRHVRAPRTSSTPSMFRDPRLRLRRVHGLRVDGAVPQRNPHPRSFHPAGDLHRGAFLAIFYTATLWLVIQAFGDAEVQGVIAQDPADSSSWRWARTSGSGRVGDVRADRLEHLAGQLAFPQCESTATASRSP